jgi:solute:Na+ symporter, SSS family
MKGALFAGLLKLPNLYLMIIPGLIALAMFPNLEKADLAFPTLTVELLPDGFRGMVLTALIAAIMSALSSALNASATLVTLDFVKPAFPNLTDRQLVLCGRSLTAVFVFIAVIYAPFIGNFKTLFEYVQSALAYIIPSIVALYFMGLFSRYITASAAFGVVVVGLVGGVTLFITKEVTTIWADLGLPDIHYTLMAVLVAIFAVVLGFTLSYFADRSKDTSDHNYVYDWHTSMGGNTAITKPVYLDSKVQAIALFILMVGIILAYS